MKPKYTSLLVLLALVLQVQLAAAQPFSVQNFKFSIKGTSSLHDWESAVEKVECNGSAVIEAGELTGFGAVVLNVPVKSIKSTKGKMMDNKTWEALAHEKHPTITFKLKEEHINKSKQTILASGVLTLAGTSQPVKILLSYKLLPKNALQLSGSHRIKMSDFNITPPTAMMGTIKVGNEVDVVFDLTLDIPNHSTRNN